MSRKQGVLTIADGKVVLKGVCAQLISISMFVSSVILFTHFYSQGGPNPVVLLSSGKSPKALKKPKKEKLGSASPRPAEDFIEAEMQLDDVFELDGFKRKNFRRWGSFCLDSCCILYALY